MSNGTLTQNQQEEVEVMSGGTGGEEASGDELNPNSPQGDEVDDFTENDEGIEYPENSTIRACISSLLTPYLYRCMVEKSDYEFLKLLNGNTENPYLIWDNATRTELLEYVKKQQHDILRTGECDASFGSDFVFSCHREELVVGDVYVRVYNEQPTFQLEDARGFAKNLIVFLGSEAEYLQSLQSVENSANSTDPAVKKGHQTLNEERNERLKNVGQALVALKNCIKTNQGVEKECIGHFKLLFSLLVNFHLSKLQLQTKALELFQFMEGPKRLSRLFSGNLPAMFDFLLTKLENKIKFQEVISCVVSNKECVNSIAESQVLGFLLVCFEQLPAAVSEILECLHNLASNRDIVKECKRKGAFIYILHEFCSSRDPKVRTKSAELFAKLMSTNLYGAEVKIFLSQFLPTLFMDAMRDNAENSVHMFESVQENPELVWKDETREKVKKTVRKLRHQLVTEQLKDPNFAFSLPKDFFVDGIRSEGLVIEGVILSIYVAQPGWVVRRPVEFMTGLLVHFKEQCTMREAPATEVELVVGAIGAFFLGQKPLLPRVCETGCIPSVIQALTSQKEAIAVSSVKVIHILAADQLCVKELSKGKVIEPLMVAMRAQKDCLAFACEALNKMFTIGDTGLVRQALDADLIELLLGLLSKPLEGLPNQKSVQAHIADALKAMAADQHLGEEVSKILDGSEVWKQFKSQKHDLFIEHTPTAGFLTEGPQVAGYLTQSAASNGVFSPPPLDPHTD